jgi:hypothetical protein
MGPGLLAGQRIHSGLHHAQWAGVLTNHSEHLAGLRAKSLNKLAITERSRDQATIVPIDSKSKRNSILVTEDKLLVIPDPDQLEFCVGKEPLGVCIPPLLKVYSAKVVSDASIVVLVSEIMQAPKYSCIPEEGLESCRISEWLFAPVYPQRVAGKTASLQERELAMD